MINITFIWGLITVIGFVVYVKRSNLNKIMKVLPFTVINELKTGEQQFMNVMNVSVYLKLLNAKVSGPSESVKCLDENIESIKLFSEFFSNNLKADQCDQLIQQMLQLCFNCATKKNIKFAELWKKYYSKGIY